MKTITLRKFLDNALSDVSLSKAETKNIVDHFRPRQQLLSRFVSGTFLVDFSSQKYLYMEETCFNVLGYTAQYFLEGGLKASFGKWHPTDLEVVNEKVWPENFSFFRAVASEEYLDYVITYNFRMRNARGEYVMLLQRSSLIAGHEPGLPAGIIGVAFDITHYKTDQTVVHTIERLTPTPMGMANDLVFKKIHPVFDGLTGPLTSRETEILRFMAEGLSSKQIAAAVQLSINTVKNHRKNMLAKTGCRSSPELVRLAVKHGLI